MACDCGIYKPGHCPCEDLQTDDPIEVWDFEDTRSDVDALRLNQREVLEADLQEAAELQEERRRLGTL